MAITHDTKLRVPAEVLLQELAGESVLLDLRAEKYFGLDESGTVLFLALKQTGTVIGALAAGLATFDVERDVLEKDLIELIERLAAEGLVIVEP